MIILYREDTRPRPRTRIWTEFVIGGQRAMLGAKEILSFHMLDEALHVITGPGISYYHTHPTVGV